MATTTRWTTVNGMVLEETVDGTTSLLLPDPQGNVVGKINSSQQVRSKTWYWPYGEVRTGTLGAGLGYGGARGYYTDTPYGSTRIYVRARYLQQNYGRWLTVDALWPSESAYTSTGNCPVSIVDPTGSKPLKCADVISCIRPLFFYPTYGPGFVINPCKCGSPKQPTHAGQADFALALCMLRAECPNWDPDNCSGGDNGGGLGQVGPGALESLCQWGCNDGMNTQADLRKHWCAGAQAAIYYLDCVGIKKYGGKAYTPGYLKKIERCAACVRAAKDDSARCKCTEDF